MPSLEDNTVQTKVTARQRVSAKFGLSLSQVVVMEGPPPLGFWVQILDSIDAARQVARQILPAQELSRRLARINDLRTRKRS